jgi:sugar lactone lactonase YvrE
LFITDGYGNARVHKFAADGTYLFSWGEPGTGPGEFNMPHGVYIDKHGRVLVCDRENDRVQVFTQEGTYLSTWPTKLIGPAVFYVDDEDMVYIPEHNAGMVSILTLEGERLTQWGDPMYRSCHGIWGDSHGDIYVVQPVKGVKGRRVVKYVRQQ